MKLITMPCSLAVLLSTLLYAQTSGQGRITGTVVNEDGQPVVQGLRVSWRWEDTDGMQRVYRSRRSVRKPALADRHLHGVWRRVCGGSVPPCCGQSFLAKTGRPRC
jgi:hypothetical protein